VLNYRQISVKSGFKKVGQLLMEGFLRTAKNRGYQCIICRIIHDPLLNQRSIMLHQKFGFNLIGNTSEDGGLMAGVYFCDLDRRRDSPPRKPSVLHLFTARAVVFMQVPTTGIIA
jgi:hypothetical protein